MIFLKNRARCGTVLMAIYAVFLLFGCGSTAEINVNSTPPTTTVVYQDVSQVENIILPANYDVEAFSQVDIVAYVSQIIWQEGSHTTQLDNSIIANLFENELARTKRFNVLSRNCRSCPAEYVYQLGNTDLDGAMSSGEQLNPQYILEATVSLGTASKELYDHNEIVFQSFITSKLIDPVSYSIIHAFEPIRFNGEAKSYFLISGKYLGGFNFNDAKSINQAYEESTQQAIAILIKKLLQYYPVGGRVTNFREGRLAIDSGIFEGISQKQSAILFLREDGLDFPIASINLTPSQHSSSGTIISWRNDKTAQLVKDALEQNGKSYLNNHLVFAVSAGISTK